MTTLWVSFESHSRDRRVWSIRAGNRWYRCKTVNIQIPMQTVYRGRQASQPKAYLRGRGRLLVLPGSGVAHLVA
jgi:uncharacterized membrane protein